MKIYFEKNTVFISDIESLKKYQVSQIEYFDFRRDRNIFSKTSDNLEHDILKVTEYLDEENISYEFSSEAASLINESKQKKAALTAVLKTAKEIKDGGILGPAFVDFLSFTKTLPRKLKTHQIKSAFHFYSLKNGANFSVPGSGKTSTILTVYEKLRIENKCNVLFIVGPPSCFQPWKNEFFETLGRVPKSLILSGGNRSDRKREYYRSKENAYEIYLTTFHTVLNDCRDILKFFSQVGISVFLVIDEAHYIKQLGGSWANSLLAIGHYANYKGVLTGTPIPKSYKDIFNLFDFLWEENSPISEDDKIQIGIWEKKKENEKIKLLLENKVGPLFYRVRKKDLGLLPAVFHDPIIVKMNKAENEIYNLIKAKVIDLNERDYFKNEDLLNKLWRGRMMRLRQSVSYPKLLLSAIEDYSEKVLEDSELREKITNYDKIEIPGKLQTLIGIVSELRERNQKVLIWSNFIGTLELIKNHFTLLGMNSELIYGKTPVRRDDIIILGEEKTREDIRDEFLDPQSGLDILIANPAACAESISLHKTCFHAIYYDLSYNCAQYIQSLDRIHRVGGSELHIANYYFLQYEKSIDQDIKNNLEVKAQKMYDIIEQDYNIYDLDIYDTNIEDDVEAYKRLFKV